MWPIVWIYHRKLGFKKEDWAFQPFISQQKGNNHIDNWTIESRWECVWGPEIASLMFRAETRSPRFYTWVGEEDTEEISIEFLFLKVSGTQILKTEISGGSSIKGGLVMEDKSLSMSRFLEGGRQNIVENLSVPELEMIQKHTHSINASWVPCISEMMLSHPAVSDSFSVQDHPR